MNFLKSNEIEDVTLVCFREFLLKNKQTNLSNKQILILI
jgi:hypothetical protein